MAKGDFTYTAKSHNFGPADPSGERLKIVVGTLNATGTYDNTNGIALNLGNYFTKILGVWVAPIAGYITEYNESGEQFDVYWADYDAVADGALVKVPDTTDIVSAYTDVAFIAFGY